MAFTIADFNVTGRRVLRPGADDLCRSPWPSDLAGVMCCERPGRTRPPLADWAQRGAILGLQGKGPERCAPVVKEMQDAGTEIRGVVAGLDRQAGDESAKTGCGGPGS